MHSLAIDSYITLVAVHISDYCILSCVINCYKIIVIPAHVNRTVIL